MNVVTISEAKKNLDALIKKIFADAEPLLIAGESGQQIVLLPLDEFNAWKETTYLLSNPSNAEHLRKSLAEARTGYLSEHELTES